MPNFTFTTVTEDNTKSSDFTFTPVAEDSEIDSIKSNIRGQVSQSKTPLISARNNNDTEKNFSFTPVEEPIPSLGNRNNAVTVDKGKALASTQDTTVPPIAASSPFSKEQYLKNKEASLNTVNPAIEAAKDFTLDDSKHPISSEYNTLSPEEEKMSKIRHYDAMSKYLNSPEHEGAKHPTTKFISDSLNQSYRPTANISAVAAKNINESIASITHATGDILQLAVGKNKVSDVIDLMAKEYDDNSEYWDSYAKKNGVTFFQEMAGAALGTGISMIPLIEFMPAELLGAAGVTGRVASGLKAIGFANKAEAMANVFTKAAGPTYAALKSYAQSNKRGEDFSNSFTAAAVAGIERYGMGIFFHGMSAYNRAVNMPVQGAAMAAQTAAHGGTAEQVASSFGQGALLGAASSGGNIGYSNLFMDAQTYRLKKALFTDPNAYAESLKEEVKSRMKEKATLHEDIPYGYVFEGKEITLEEVAHQLAKGNIHYVAALDELTHKFGKDNVKNYINNNILREAENNDTVEQFKKIQEAMNSVVDGRHYTDEKVKEAESAKTPRAPSMSTEKVKDIIDESKIINSKVVKIDTETGKETTLYYADEIKYPELSPNEVLVKRVSGKLDTVLQQGINTKGYEPKIGEATNEEKELIDMINVVQKDPKFAERLKAVSEAIVKTSDDSIWSTLQKMFNPTNVSPEAHEQASIIKHHSSKKIITELSAEMEFGKIRNAINTLSVEDQLKTLFEKESLVGIRDPKMRDIQMKIQAIREPLWKWVADSKGIETFIENYLQHRYLETDKAAKVYKDKLLHYKSLLKRNPDYFNKREILTYEEAIKEHGLTPASTNWVDIELRTISDLLNFRMTKNILDESLSKGLIQGFKLESKTPEGWVKLNSTLGPIFRQGKVRFNVQYDIELRKQLENVLKKLDIEHHVGDVKKMTGLKDKGVVWGAADSRQGDFSTGKGYKIFSSPESREGTIAHELGHVIDWRYGIGETIFKRPELLKEIKKLAVLRDGEDVKDISKERMRYLLSREELNAVMLEAYVTAKDYFKEKAPKAFEAYDKIIKSTPDLSELSTLKPTIASGARTVEKNVGGPVLSGYYAAPRDVARILNNYVSPGISGNKIYKSLRKAGNIMNQIQLGLSGFHFFFTSVDTISSTFALGLQELARGNQFDSALKHMTQALVAGPVSVYNMYKEGKKFQNDIKNVYTGTGIVTEDMRLIHAISQAGGSIGPDLFYKNSAGENYIKAWREGHKLSAVMSKASNIVESLSGPLMDKWVPRLKLGMFHEMVKSKYEQWDRIGVRPTLEMKREVFSRIHDSIENRMGQIRYDNLFWNTALKNGLFAAVRSVGWNLGTWRELGGGSMEIFQAGGQALRNLAGGQEGKLRSKLSAENERLSTKMAYSVAFPIIASLYGALYQGMRTWATTGTFQYPGEDDPSFSGITKDLFMPRTGNKLPDGTPERMVLQSYMRDMFSYLHSPLGTLSSKIHPEVTTVWHILNNHDYHGVSIVDPKYLAKISTIKKIDAESIYETLEAEAGFIAKQFIPFSIGTIHSRMKGSATESTAEQIMKFSEGFSGITPASRKATRSTAQNLMAELANKHFGSSKNAEEYLISQYKTEYRKALQTGNKDLVDEIQKEHVLNMRAMRNIKKHYKDSSDKVQFHILTPQEGMDVLSVAREKELQWMVPALKNKIMRSKSITTQQRKTYINELKDYQ